MSYILPALGAAAIAGMLIPTQTVQAASSDTASSVAVFQMNSSDPYAVSTIKALVIEDLANRDDSISLENVDFDNSTIAISGLNTNKSGIQAVSLKLSLAQISDDSKSVGYTYSETAAINVTTDSAPTLKLKKNSVTVNNGDTWNPSSYISTITDDSGALPVLKESDNVNMSVDGDYYATYTAIDAQGNKTSVVLNVTVKTPQEVIDAQNAAAEEAAAAEQAAAEQAAKEAEEKQKAAEEAALLAAANSTSVTGKVYGTSGENPYPGGWSNCTYGAWEALYESTGISLPNFGNAGNWVSAASSDGYATGTTPAVGSIAVYTGHVAYVDSVSADGTAVHIVEGGFNGGYNERWVSADGTGTQALRGYIYAAQ